ncbi:protein FAR1-RELATED SEQUENCE 5-like [Arachis hypogaea]|uniref:protein FAR1-RELATED SEQUENCE 5-like n=1 Tax=Arachis hypogaea TaxID=3818 RepID=UPI000DECD4F9|nr:protein FAR1-RELATED SEQUENCE 5-like [Arachis hypogaea]
MQLQFIDEEAIYRFYKTYAMMHGFAVRLDEVRHNSDGCVVLFYEEHSHGLVDPLDVSMMPEYRTFSVSDKAQVKNLHDICIRTYHILGYLVVQQAGYANLSFNQKDMYNLITQHRKEKVKGGDANAAINYLRGKVGNDSYFFGKNVYNKSLVIFSSSNHHGHTVIFGCGLLVNKGIGSYKWLLETFLEVMGNKHPMAVVTDRDLSMREAIKQVFPYATHRLSVWHLHRNACEKVKNSGFLNDFKNLTYANVSVEEFQVMWGDMVARYNLSSNSWVDQTYKLRNLWALAYLRDQFFGQIRTTSQCEGINSLIKAYMRKKDTLLEFINNMETVVSHYKNNERVAEFNSKYTDPVLVNSLPTLEDFAAKTFTRNMFQEVRKEIEGACAMNTEMVIQDGGKLYFKYNSLGVPEIDHMVQFDRVGGMLRWHYKKSCPNVPGRIPKEPVDDDTEKNISSHLDILTKKMEKDRNIGGGTAPTSAAKSAFTDQVKTSSAGPDISVCASTSNEESRMSSRPVGSPVVAPETGMAD